MSLAMFEGEVGAERLSSAERARFDAAFKRLFPPWVPATRPMRRRLWTEDAKAWFANHDLYLKALERAQ